uniref:Putative ml domain salivary peptide n=1 Tax=Corethrella appendiculata TaxID=1370023 RepID=U5EYI9_9DIPT
MLRYLLIAVILPVFVYGQIHTPCNNYDNNAVDVIVENCTKLPCEIENESWINSTILFIAPGNHKQLKTEFAIMLGDFRVPYDLPADKQIGCNWLVGDGCPLVAGQKYNYNFVNKVESPFSNIEIGMEFTLVDENQQTVLCYRSRALILPRSNTGQLILN